MTVFDYRTLLWAEKAATEAHKVTDICLLNINSSALESDSYVLCQLSSHNQVL